uniref:Uncharacterized protein n=1 Tax=Parascaris equorum TaxID=6256 RepID=A0A914R2R6_PAREQ
MASCGECSGVACIRFRSFSTEHNHEIALTCLPYATRFLPSILIVNEADSQDIKVYISTESLFIPSQLNDLKERTQELTSRTQSF